MRCPPVVRVLSLLSAVLVSAPAPEIARAEEVIAYHVRFANADNHYLEVEATFPTRKATSMDFVMATWTPGSYLMREYARHIESLRAFDTEGQLLKVTKTGKDRWNCDVSGKSKVKLQYRLYCREMSVRTNWVEEKFAILNGAPTFLTSANLRDLPHRVRLDLPDAWKTSATALDAYGDKAHHYQARNYDELVDSPILAGNLELHPFKAGDREHWLVNLGDDTFWDGAAAARDLARLVSEQHRFWGTVPYPRYLFLNVIAESGGGLEHDNSTLMMTSRWSYRDRTRYVNWLSLASHEFFHTWNIRRLRPKELVQYDYQNENYTRALWIAEGITSYYDDLYVRRAGLCTDKEYLNLLAKQIRTLETTPGRRIQSLHDSSFDTWIKFYRPDENSKNSRISYYTKGAVTAFLLDARIRRLSEDQQSLDDVMRLMYERFLESGYTHEDFAAVVAEVAGSDQSAWLKRMLETTVPLRYDDALDWFGLKFEQSPNKPPSPTASNGAGAAFLGLTADNQSGQLKVTYVQRQSPAARAGINVGDELIAFGGYRVTPTDWQQRLKQYSAGTRLDVTLARRQKIETLQVELGTLPPATWKLMIAKSDDEAVTERRTRWLNGHTAE